MSADIYIYIYIEREREREREVCELIGIFMLSLIGKKYNRNNMKL